MGKKPTNCNCVCEEIGWVRLGGLAEGEAETTARRVCERPEPLGRACCCPQLYISQGQIEIGMEHWERKTEPRATLASQERRWGKWSGWKGTRYAWGCSDSSGAAKGEECRLFLPFQTSCPTASPSVVINTRYFPFSPFQSIDKSRVRPAETMALSSAPSDVVWMATAPVVGMVQEELLGDMRDSRNSRKGAE